MAMKANSLRQDLESNDPVTEQQAAWDAQRVWRERVSNGPAVAAEAAPAQGWDPYLVWLSRVKRD